MALPLMTTNVANHAAVVEDYPQDNGANPLTPAELRTLLDKGAVDIKSFLNDILIPALIAGGIPFTPTAGISSDNLQDAVEEVYAAIAEAVSGEIIDGSITFSKLAGAALASQADALAATATNKIISPLRVKEYVTSILATLAEAQAGTSETKLVTPKRVADYLAYIQATQAEAQAGVNTTHWTTPQRVAQYVTAILATQAEAQAGTNTTHLMNPLRVSQAITALAPRVVAGSYSGTGTYGLANAKTLIFSFAPKLIFINKRGSLYALALMPCFALTTTYLGAGFSYLNDSTRLGLNAKKSADGKTVYWYDDAAPDWEYNSAGENYDYVAIG